MAKSAVSFKTHRFKLQADSSDEVEIRSETFLGRNYTVVPVVAMVEGVRFGAAQTDPELGLASEFGATPVLWNNRPIVLNHPKKNKKFVSANESIDVLEAFSFGFTMNAELDDDKLKMEAWIEDDRVSELGEKAEEIVQAIKDGEMVEVSTGFFSQIDDKKGKFKGQSYKGVWRNVQPDHLAILELGSVGACSNDDGCGIPRINEEGDMAKDALTTGSSCSCGGKHPHVNEEDDAGEQTGDEEKKPKQKSQTSVPSVASTAPIEVQDAEDRADFREQMQRQVTQELGSDILSGDIAKVVQKALQRKYRNYVYVYGFSKTHVIFEAYTYDSERFNYNGYICYRQAFNVSNEGKVEFVGEPEEVILLTKIVPQEQSPTPVVQTKENDMADAPKVEEKTEEKPVVQAATPEVVAPKVLSAQEYIDNAPPEIRDMLNASMRAQAARKEELIKTLTENKKCKFTKEVLLTKPVDELEALVELSGAAPSYKGVAPANQPYVQENSEPRFMNAPKIWGEEKKDAAAA